MLYHGKVSIHLKIGYLNQIITGFLENLKSGIFMGFFEYPGGDQKILHNLKRGKIYVEIIILHNVLSYHSGF